MMILCPHDRQRWQNMSWEYHQDPVRDGRKNKRHVQGNRVNKICLADEWLLIDLDTYLMAGYSKVKLLHFFKKKREKKRSLAYSMIELKCT